MANNNFGPVPPMPQLYQAQAHCCPLSIEDHTPIGPPFVVTPLRSGYWLQPLTLVPNNGYGYYTPWENQPGSCFHGQAPAVAGFDMPQPEIFQFQHTAEVHNLMPGNPDTRQHVRFNTHGHFVSGRGFDMPPQANVFQSQFPDGIQNRMPGNSDMPQNVRFNTHGHVVSGRGLDMPPPDVFPPHFPDGVQNVMPGNQDILQNVTVNTHGHVVSGRDDVNEVIVVAQGERTEKIEETATAKLSSIDEESTSPSRRTVEEIPLQDQGKAVSAEEVKIEVEAAQASQTSTCIAVATTSNGSTSKAVAKKSKGSASPKTVGKICILCRSNRETEAFFSSHVLKDENGIVRCPVLRGLSCYLCGATGDYAHTSRYCPNRAYYRHRGSGWRGGHRGENASNISTNRNAVGRQKKCKL